MNVTIYRHAQSKANAGESTENPVEIPLTPLGHRQAELLSKRMESPTLIVTSPFLRTGETAIPTRTRFPDVPHEQWPIQEFTYLSAEPLRGTTRFDRQDFAKVFWDREDPTHREPGAESLGDLFERVQAMVDRLEKINDPLGEIAVFGHGMFMRATLWCLLTNSYTVSPDTMKSFRSFCSALPIPNTVAMPLTFTGTRWYVGALNIGHLPSYMVTS